MSLLRGMYVRVPYDEDLFPSRTFVMAQILKDNSTAKSVLVKKHDLWNAAKYYPELFVRKEFSYYEIMRAEIPAGVQVITSKGFGTVLCIAEKETDTYWKYYVSFQGNKNYVILSESDLIADFSAFEINPLNMALKFEFQNPSWFANRYVVKHTMQKLENAVYGVKTLSGCRIHLLTHQINTIIKCLSDSDHMRYVLADEVGMGKTIETCGILRLRQEKDPNARFLFVIPSNLIPQWQFELRYKFSILAREYSIENYDCQHIIIPLENFAEYSDYVKSQDNFDVLIVDEVHTILTQQNIHIYDILLSLSEKIPNILLLSATPISSRENEYYQLMRLLYPHQYSDKSIFDQRINCQKYVEQVLYDLDYYCKIDIADAWEEIQDLLSEASHKFGDPLLEVMIKKIQDPDEKSKEQLYQISSYIAEHYRLGKNIVRNRRATYDKSNLDSFENLQKRERIHLSYHENDENVEYGEYETIDAITSWISSLQDISLKRKMIKTILPATFSSPWALKSSLDKFSDQVDIPEIVWEKLNQWLMFAEEELLSVDDLLDAYPDRITGRLVLAWDFIEENTRVFQDSACKAVVFSDFPETVEKFYKIATHRKGNNRVALFYSDMSDEDLQENVNRFQDDPDCKLIICDRSGGEGRNFQMAEYIIHLDTPWSINNIEQRIGRLDRLGRAHDFPTKSIILHTENTIESQFIHLLDNSIGIYTSSLSGMEIVTKEIQDMIEESIVEDVSFGLAQIEPSLNTIIQDLRNKINREKVFDRQMESSKLKIETKKILEDYQGNETKVFSDSMLSWAGMVGLNKSTDIDELTEFRPSFFSSGSAFKSFYVPPAWDEYDSERYHLVLDSDNHRIITGNRSNIVIKGTFSRDKAINQEDLIFFAPSDPIFDSIISNALYSYRGKCCAVSSNSWPFTYKGFALIWIVTPDYRYLYRNNIDPIALSNYKIYLPQEPIITLSPYKCSNDIPQPEVIHDFLLNNPWIVAKSQHLGERKYGSLDKFKDQFGQNWTDYINQTYKMCYLEAKKITEQISRLKTAKQEIAKARYANESAAHFYGDKDYNVTEKRQYYQALCDSLEHYSLSIDSVIFMDVKNENS